MLANLAAALNDVSLFECRETAPAIAPDRLVEREHRGAGPAVESPLVGVFVPLATSGTRSRPNAPPRGRTRAMDFNAAVRSRGLVSDCRTPYGAITAEKDLLRNGSARMSPRTSLVEREAFVERASICAERSIPMMSMPARASGTVTRPVPDPSSSTGPPVFAATRRQNPTSRRPSVRAFSQS
mgnify:CR=1 FL=1